MFTWRYFPKYVEKKAENLATKEDITEITERTEQARLPYIKATERLRSELQHQSASLTRLQELYIALAESSADAFLAGRNATPEQKTRFLASYTSAFLYAPDDVVGGINDHLDVQLRITEENQRELQPELHCTYAKLMITLRRAAFVDEGTLDASSYRFVSFS